MEYDLVFEGGGAKGMVFVGAMQEFEKRGHRYKRLLGTSAGAITATLLAAGYTAQEMQEALGEKENGASVFEGFMGHPGPYAKDQVLHSVTLSFLQDVDLPFIPNFIENKVDQMIVEWLSSDPRMANSYSLLEFGGWYSAAKFIEWMKRRLDTGMNQGKPRQYSGMNLKQFFEATQSDLSVVASDTTAGAMLVLNHRTAPDVPLVWAVRMSMSIPLLWQEVIWKEEWGKYRGREMAGHAIVDGGMLSNFPIELFLSQDGLVKKLMGEDAGQGVLGMMIDESIAVEPAPVAAVKPVVDLGQLPLLRRIKNLVDTTLSARDKMVSEEAEKMVVRLPAGGYGTTEFDMSEEKRARLVNAGSDAMRIHLDQLQAQEEAAAMGAVSFDTAAIEKQIQDEERLKRQADKVAMKIFK